LKLTLESTSVEEDRLEVSRQSVLDVVIEPSEGSSMEYVGKTVPTVETLARLRNDAIDNVLLKKPRLEGEVGAWFPSDSEECVKGIVQC